MKKILFLFNLLCSIQLYAQEKLVADLDGDKIADTVFLDVNSSRIVCKLSSSGFKIIKSGELDLIGDQNSITKTKSGFELSVSFMRAGHACQFRYDATTKKIQLIGMSEYAFGNAANDGSGKGSVNLLTNMYIGEWNAYDEKKQKLVKLPIIKQKMVLGKIYLEKFESKAVEDFAVRSSVLYEEQKSLFVK